MNTTRTPQRGFSLIEVLVALLVLSVGLLGYAMLQTMTVRFTQSANYRTQATNLTYELIDQMRANRATAVTYVGEYKAAEDTSDCLPATGANQSAAAFSTAFRCRLALALGTQSSANVGVDGDWLEVTVTWSDERWDVASEGTKFEARTRL